MAKIIFECEELDLDHSEMINLKKDGYLTLGIENSHKKEISQFVEVDSKKIKLHLINYFWYLVGIVFFGYSIYMSFTREFYIFLAGFFILYLVRTFNKKDSLEYVQNSELLDFAERDEDFFNKVKDMGYWIYFVDEEKIKDYLI
jgi:hypothetical protein